VGFCASLCAVVVGGVGASGASLSGSPSAPGSLQAKAGSLAATIQADAVEIHSLGVRYTADEARVQQLAAAEQLTMAEMRLARTQVSAARVALSKEAVNAYVDAGTGSSLNLLFAPASGTADGAATTAAYLAVSSDDLTSASASLQASLVHLGDTLALEQRARAAVLANLRSLAVTRTAAFAAIAAEEEVLSQVKGQMAHLVAAAEAAAEERAAQQAARAAHAPPPPPVQAQGPPVPAGPPSVGIPGPVPSSLAADFAKVRTCESGNDYGINTGNGYYGAYQFSLSTWEGLGYSGLPSNASPAEQDAAAYKLYQEGGWSSWPACSAMLGL
jgi:hypothetical protein